MPDTRARLEQVASDRMAAAETERANAAQLRRKGDTDRAALTHRNAWALRNQAIGILEAMELIEKGGRK